MGQNDGGGDNDSIIIFSNLRVRYTIIKPFRVCVCVQCERVLLYYVPRRTNRFGVPVFSCGEFKSSPDENSIWRRVYDSCARANVYV